ncbi:MAG: GTP-binding protein [bacterium]|nr:GTP-binding protein [bacterium]
MEQKTGNMRERPPIVAVVGHIDHGKSTLLDYIRKTNTVESEAGGITQHLSAYEVEHSVGSTHSINSGQASSPQGKKITFLDTPGHEAFQTMRSRGLEVADIAILVVSAEDGVKVQTKEALALIEAVHIPYIVALTKIDKPAANIERAKNSLLENGIYLEGLGGTVPYVGVSGKTGEGVPELLDLILLSAELEGLYSDPEALAEGLVIEAYVDQKRGNTATLIVQQGVVKAGEYVVCGGAVAPVRIMENYSGKSITEAAAGSPVRIVGFSSLPQVGASFKAVKTKKEAERDAVAFRRQGERILKATPLEPELRRRLGKSAPLKLEEGGEEKITTVLPIVIKTDFAGTGDAVLHELEKLPQHENLEVRVVARSVGAISENDVKLVGSGETPGIVVGFNVKVEKEARTAAERLGVAVAAFDIIYKLAEWLGEEVEKRRPHEQVDISLGSAKILKVFSAAKGRTVLGGRIEEGALVQGKEVKIMRGGFEIGHGELVSLQKQKTPVTKLEAGSEFGAMVRLSAQAGASVVPAAGDYLEAFEVVEK